MRDAIIIAVALCALVGCGTSSGGAVAGPSDGGSAGSASTSAGAGGTGGGSSGIGGAAGSMGGGAAGATGAGGAGGPEPTVGDGGACAGLSLDAAPVVTPTSDPGPAPVLKGGYIPEGLYYLQSDVRYPAATPLATMSYRGAVQFAGGAFVFTDDFEGTAKGSYILSGSNLQVTWSCPNQDGATFGFSVIPGGLQLMPVTGWLQTYAKQ